MLEENLPKPLQTTLDTLLMDNKLSSWQIRGGEHFIQVTIRFSATTIGCNETNVKYRRAPPSRILRDNDRARNHQFEEAECMNEHGIINRMNNTIDAQNVTTLENNGNVNVTNQIRSTVPCPPATTDLSISPTNSNVQSMEQHTSDVDTGNIDINTNSIDLNNSVRDSVISVETDDSEDDRLQKLLEYMDRFEESCDRIDKKCDQINDNLVESVSHSMNTRTDTSTKCEVKCDMNDDDDSVSDGTYTCDGCGGMIDAKPDSMWYRCTHCGDVDICHECFIKDVHNHHKAHLQVFKAPADWNVPYCDSCGLSFNDYESTLYKCTMCEDYCLCQHCKNNLLHIHHSKYIKGVSVQQYSKDIG